MPPRSDGIRMRSAFRTCATIRRTRIPATATSFSWTAASAPRWWTPPAFRRICCAFCATDNIIWSTFWSRTSMPTTAMLLPKSSMDFPRAKIVMHAADAHALGTLSESAMQVRDGEELPFGDVRIRMLHTPGHTDGSSSYLFKSTIFTGDTLFAGSVGGAYGDASTYEDILNSVRSKIFTLPDDTVVMPGHGPPSKVSWERDHNPFF